MMRNVKTQILINFFVAAALIIGAIAVVVSWQLSKNVTAQTRVLAHRLSAETRETLLSHSKILDILISNIKKDLSSACLEVISNQGVKAGIDFGMYEQVNEFLDATCRIKKIDFAFVYGKDGELLAAFPAVVDRAWLATEFKLTLSRSVLIETVKNKLKHPATPVHVELCHKSLDFLKASRLGARDIDGKGALSAVAAGIIMDDEYAANNFFIIGRFLNQYHEPLEQLYEVTGSAAAIFIDQTPIAFAGFPFDDIGAINDRFLQLRLSAQPGLPDGMASEAGMIFSGESYLTAARAIECSDGGKIGMTVVGIPEKNLMMKQNEYKIRGLAATRRVQLWILGVGVFALILFVVHSMLLANQVAKPITRAKENLEIEVTHRTSELAQAYEELKVTVDELIAAKEVAEDANRSKSDFLANMSHELRTPLNHIIGFTELVVREQFGELNPMQKEYLSDSLGSSKHLLSLINDILDLSKVEAGKLEVHLEPVDLQFLLEHSLTMVKEKALKNNVQLLTEVGDIPEEVFADERKIKQIVYNLLSNAVKFTPEGGTVTLKAVKTDGARDIAVLPKGCNLPVCRGREDPSNPRDFIKISVIDTGVGLDKEHVEMIFNPFEQVETSRTRQFQGTGLGLSLSRRLVELHGGVIWAESGGMGTGAQFSFLIPI